MDDETRERFDKLDKQYLAIQSMYRDSETANAALLQRIDDMEAQLATAGTELATLVHEDITAIRTEFTEQLAGKNDIAVLREEMSRRFINIQDNISMTGKSLLDAYDEHSHPHTHPSGCDGPAEAA